MSYKPTYSIYKYNSNGDFIRYNKYAHLSDARFPTVWAALDSIRKLARERYESAGGKTTLELDPDLQYIIVEFFGPRKSRIKCIVSQEEIMQEKFEYNLENISGKVSEKI